METPNPDHPIRNTLKHLALGAVATVAFAIPLAHADLVSVNIGGGNAAGQSTVVDPPYGIWSEGAKHWNTIGSSTASPSAVLVDSGGAPTGITVGLSTGSHAGNWTGGTNDGLVANGRFQSPSATITTTISGLQINTTYSLLVYHADEYPSSTVTVNGAAAVDFTGSVGSTGYADAFDGLTGSDFWYFSSIDSGPAGVLTIASTSGGFSTICGFQLQPSVSNLRADLTNPANGSNYLVGATIPATASVVSGTAPYSVEFFLDSGSGFVSRGTDTVSPYTVDLTGLAIGAYSLKATVTDSTSATDDSPTRTFTVSNAGPSNLAAVSGNQLVNLSWNPVLGATGYTILRSSPDNSSYSEIATGITDLSFQDTPLTNGTPYFYVVKATVGATVSDSSNEVSATPVAVGNNNSTVVASPLYVLADGVATSTITVTLKDGGNAPAAGLTVTLASSRPTDDTVSAASGLSDANGVVTFTVSSSVAGISTYTATVTDVPLALTDTAIVGFIAPAIPPPVTAGLKLHLDASQIPSSDGASLHAWPDMSGLGNHTVSSAGTPTYRTNVLNGKPVVRFNGTSSFTTADLSSQFPAAASVFAVISPNNDNNYSAFGNRNNNDRWVGGNYSEVTPGVFRGSRANFSSSYSLMPSTGSHIFAYESSSSAYKFLLNGNLIGTTTGNYNSGSGQTWGIGFNGSLSDTHLNGDIAEIILYDRVLTSTEANQVGSYLAIKYGLTTTYPTGGFGTWASANGATGQTPQQDHDNDGVDNGIEYFMGATGSTFTANPGLNAANAISWPASAAYSGTYEVQTSPDLGTWTNVDPRPAIVNGFLNYTLPPGAPGGKSFVRLLVTPTP